MSSWTVRTAINKMDCAFSFMTTALGYRDGKHELVHGRGGPCLGVLEGRNIPIAIHGNPPRVIYKGGNSAHLNFVQKGPPEEGIVLGIL